MKIWKHNRRRDGRSTDNKRSERPTWTFGSNVHTTADLMNIFLIKRKTSRAILHVFQLKYRILIFIVQIVYKNIINKKKFKTVTRILRKLLSTLSLFREYIWKRFPKKCAKIDKMSHYLFYFVKWFCCCCEQDTCLLFINVIISTFKL